MRRLSTAAVLALALVFASTATAEPPASDAVVAKKKKCFKKKHGKRVRVKCPKKKTTPPPNPAPTPPSDSTGQAAVDQMTTELKGGRWRYFTSGYETSTSYELNLCADGTFLRIAESAGVQTFRYGTWTVTEAVVFADGSGRAAHVVGTVTQSDPPGAENVDTSLAFRAADSQWLWGENAAQYFAGAAVCS